MKLLLRKLKNLIMSFIANIVCIVKCLALKWHSTLAEEDEIGRILKQQYREQGINEDVEVVIVLAGYAKYPLERTKYYGKNTSFKCGLAAVFKNISKYVAGAKFKILLVINNANDMEKASIRKLAQNFAFVYKILFRSNVGYDFGAYNLGYRCLKKINYNGDIVFMNCSVNGPNNDNWLLKYYDLFHSIENVGIVGASICSHTLQFETIRFFKPHIQSFFLYTNMEVLRSVFKENLPAIFIKKDKLAIITIGEIGLSQQILKKGYSIAVPLFNNFFYKRGKAWAIPYGSYREKILNRI